MDAIERINYAEKRIQELQLLIRHWKEEDWRKSEDRIKGLVDSCSQRYRLMKNGDAPE
tara:strand:- start:638 stop:811 length:174 start_codon:yes stop_codon:yes gene_type:complete